MTLSRELNDLISIMEPGTSTKHLWTNIIANFRDYFNKPRSLKCKHKAAQLSDLSSGLEDLRDQNRAITSLSLTSVLLNEK